jgi:hypothetical protein
MARQWRTRLGCAATHPDAAGVFANVKSTPPARAEMKIPVLRVV